MSKIFVLIISLGIVCHATTQGQDKYITISMTKTPCFGQCPTYIFKLNSDHTASYDGEANVEMMGSWSSVLTEEQYQDLLKEFEESDFFQFSERYYKELTGLPTTYLLYSDGEKEKKVMDYYGAPEKIKELENKIEELIAHLKWAKKTN